MDVLADILHQAGMKGRILHHRGFRQPMALKFPCERSVGFHVVIQGEAHLHSEQTGRTEVITLRRGDIALMARGLNHIVSTEARFPKSLVRPIEPSPVPPLGEPEDAPYLLSLVSGAYQLWNAPVHPFFKELPDWFVLRAEEVGQFEQLPTVVALLASEIAHPGIGSDSVVRALLDILFTHIVRRIVVKVGGEPRRWSHAIQDPQIHRSIELMHLDCAQPWTLDRMAREVGLSRAGFAAKFKQSLGDTPLHYLTTVRVQRAISILTSTTDTIESVARAVGYQDAFGFSKTFKKVTGLSPREFRARDQNEQGVAWRY